MAGKDEQSRLPIRHARPGDIRVFDFYLEELTRQELMDVIAWLGSDWLRLSNNTRAAQTIEDAAIDITTRERAS